MSVCTMASGTVICNKSWLWIGTCTVSRPIPDLRQALADKIEAPAMPYEPAMSNPCPNVPLCANRLRGLMSERISASSMVKKVLDALSMKDCFKPMSNNSHSPTISSFSGKRKDNFGSWMLRVTLARTILGRTLYVLSSPMSPEGMSIDTTSALEALMYFTTAAKPPFKGLFNPLPNNPSITK